MLKNTILFDSQFENSCPYIPPFQKIFSKIRFTGYIIFCLSFFFIRSFIYAFIEMKVAGEWWPGPVNLRFIETKSRRLFSNFFYFLATVIFEAESARLENWRGGEFPEHFLPVLTRY